MAKDYLNGLESKLKRIEKTYEWYLECGDLPLSAYQKTLNMAARDWPKIKSLLGHAKHGRCGGNADEALGRLQDCLAGLTCGKD